MRTTELSSSANLYHTTIKNCDKLALILLRSPSCPSTRDPEFGDCTKIVSAHNHQICKLNIEKNPS